MIFYCIKSVTSFDHLKYCRQKKYLKLNDEYECFVDHFPSTNDVLV